MRILYESFLAEHNVVNKDSITNYCADFADACDHVNAKAWFNHSLAKYLEKDEEINVPMTTANTPRAQPEWLKAAKARGDDLRVFQAPHHLDDTFSHLVDYFNYLNRADPRFLDDKRRVLAVTVPVAIQKSEEWTRADARKAEKTEAKDFKLIWRDGPYSWVEATTKEALNRDGSILQNCIGQGTYDACVNNTSRRIVFLHDHKGLPHVAIRMKGQAIQEIKGKQNQPPMGRYITLTANFLNHAKLTGGQATNDLRRMGLVYDDETKHYGTKSDFAETVYEFPDGVTVLKSKADPTTTQYGNHEDGGMDYWFKSPNEGDFIHLNMKNKLISLRSFLNGMDLEKVRHYVQTFLNEGFPDGAPMPHIMYSSYGEGQRNRLSDVKLYYDYFAKKYGYADEVSENTTTVDGYDVYLRGTSLHNTEFQAYKDGEERFTIPKSGVGIGTPTLLDDDHEAGMFTVLNALNMPPRFNMLLQDNIVFYNDGRYGSLADVGTKVWSAGSYAAYSWQNFNNDQLETIVSVLNESQSIFYIKKSGDLVGDELDSQEVTKVLLRLLSAPAMKWVQSTAYNFDRFDVFFSGSKWTTRAKAGKLFHKFDDGYYWTSFERKSFQVFTLYNGADRPVIGMDIEGKSTIARQRVFGALDLSASHHLLWLLNSQNFDKKDTVDASPDYQGNGNDRAFLWRMGLFYDNRTEQWKLIQDGKLLHAGDGYRAVNFRNRVFFVSDSKGILGYAKAEDALGHSGMKKYLNDERSFPGQSMPDLYAAMADFARAMPDYAVTKLDIRKNDYDHVERRYHGYFHDDDDDNTFKAIEEKYPTQVVLKLGKGFKWIRRAVDQAYKSDESHEPRPPRADADVKQDVQTLHHDRYTLEDSKDKPRMRVEFDDGFLKRFYAEDQTGRGFTNQTTALNRLSEPQKKVLIALLEKLDARITPAQCREFGYYRTKSGKYKTFSSNSSLKAYFDGFIKFADGHAFMFDKYNDTWTLGMAKDDNDSKYDRDRLESPYVRVKLDADGLESVHYIDKKVKRKPKEYVPYIHKLLSLFATVSGD